MPKDPIQELKEELQKVLPLFDELRTEINASRQGAASTKLKEIEENLSSLRERINNDFHWLLPKETPAPKKTSFFGMKR